MFKKKPAEPTVFEDQPAEAVTEKQIQIDDIAIHAMPDRFRHQPVKADNAKNVGLLIIGGGIVVLIAVSFGLYFYLFKKPTVIIKQEESTAAVNSASQSNQVQPETNQNTANPGTLTEGINELITPPADNDLTDLAATSTPEEIEQNLTTGFVAGLDSDNDALTNAEEILIGTATSTPDTDGDGYLDGAEILNLYDPAGPGKLTANPNIAFYENATFNYSVLYPKVWTVTVNGGDDSIMFRTTDNQFLQIIVQLNIGQEPLDQWYLNQLGAETINDSDRLSGANWQGVKSSDGLSLYLMDPQQEYIFTLAYNPGESNILEYQNIFNMMIRSFNLE